MRIEMQAHLRNMKERLADERFSKFYDLLSEWNKCFNLTSITQKEDVYIKHFLDSLAGEKYLSGTTVLDVGSGAGFPSIPIKIIRDDLNFTLIDSVRKKVNFTTEAAAALGLSKIQSIHCRVEDHKIFDYDHAVARAVAPLNILAEYTLPFVKSGGTAVLYKGFDIEEELKNASRALKILGGEVWDVIKYSLGESDNLRSLIIIKKIAPTPKGYPRKLNKPRLNPL